MLTDPLQARFEQSQQAPKPRQRVPMRREFRCPDPTVPSTEAGPCPRCPAEYPSETRLYATDGPPMREISKMVCDRCGHTWTARAERQWSLTAFLARLADALTNARRIDTDKSGQVVVIDDDAARAVTAILHKLTN